MSVESSCHTSAFQKQQENPPLFRNETSALAALLLHLELLAPLTNRRHRKVAYYNTVHFQGGKRGLVSIECRWLKHYKDPLNKFKDNFKQIKVVQQLMS